MDLLSLPHMYPGAISSGTQSDIDNQIYYYGCVAPTIAFPGLLSGLAGGSCHCLPRVTFAPDIVNSLPLRHHFVSYMLIRCAGSSPVVHFIAPLPPAPIEFF